MSETPKRVAVVETGVANAASMLAALRRAGAEPFLTRDPAAIEQAKWVVLPGVGAFAAGMQVLRESGLAEPLSQRARAGKPLLAVCLGLQLLCASSEESPGVAGLGLLDQQVGRFQAAVTVPQIGWNQVEPQPHSKLLQPGYAYFANSYRLATVPAGYAGAIAEHGEPFVAAIERGSLLACQFHPELSGAWGACLIERWLASGEASAC